MAERPERCKTCRFFDPFPDEDEPDSGYCTQPFVEDDKTSVHYEYGGHWTCEDEWCNRWKGGDPVWVKAETVPHAR